MERYDPQAIEAKWQQVWEDEQAFVVPNPEPGAVRDASKTYVVEMLPYPSGELHMGHTLNYTIGDVLVHLRRRRGVQVLRPMGYDAFGLPAENAAIREGGHPREVTERNIAADPRADARMGWAIDWSRELSTHDPAYYRWTQWLFLRFFEKGLAYRKEAPVKWCPNDQTVLANEQVVDGHCERCGAEVEAKSLTQWFFKITDYADELLDEMDTARGVAGADADDAAQLDRSLAGRPRRRSASQGVGRGAAGLHDPPRHAVRRHLLRARPRASARPLARRRNRARGKRSPTTSATRRPAPPVERETKEKDGVFTGRYAVNPVNDESIPIWVADYVLMEYGTGAIMAVPAHDERDHAFAERYGIEVRQVVAPAEGSEPTAGAFVAHTDDEVLVNSGDFSGMSAPEAKAAITAWLSEQGTGEATIGYRLRDWLLSRQRYWGCPIPIVHCDACGAVPVPDDQLPVLLPDIDDFMPKGRSPLAVGRGVGRHGLPLLRRAGTQGDGHDGHVRRLVLVLHPLLRPAERPRAVLARARRLLDADQPVHRRASSTPCCTCSTARFFAKVMNEMGLIGFREPWPGSSTRG